MKKLLVMFLALAVVLSLSACGKDKAETVKTEEKTAAVNSSKSTESVEPSSKTTFREEISTEKSDKKTDSDDSATEKTIKIGNNTKVVSDSTKPKTTNSTKVVSDSTKPKTTKVPETHYGTIITNSFIVKNSSGTNLTLSRYDKNAGELKEGLYTCNYGSLDGSADMHFKVGDVVTVRYDYEVYEVYPYQLNVREIYIAVWN